MQATRGAALNASATSGEGPTSDPAPATTETADPDALHPRAQSRGRAISLVAVVAAGFLVLDVLTKNWAVSTLTEGQPRPLLGRVLQLHLVYNPGAAFSLGERATVFFAVLAIVAVVVLCWFSVTRVRMPIWSVVTGLLLAGVGGNLIDRLTRAPGPMRGHVVDFLQLPHWPIFNVADICLTTAAVAVVIFSFVSPTGPDGRPVSADRRR